MESALTPAATPPKLDRLRLVLPLTDAMNDTTQVHPLPPPAETGAKELAEERRRIDRRDWWVLGYSIFVILLLTFAVISLTLPALLTAAETFFKTKRTAPGSGT